MKDSLLKRIELVANVCIIVVALVICAAVANRLLLKSPSSLSGIQGIAAGTKISLAEIDFARNGQTLLLVLSTDCKFCSASAPFYQNLATRTGSTHGTKLIALLPQGLEQSREYLKSLNVPIDEVRQTQPASVGVRATPTLILINSAGIVTNSWVGQLQSDKETEVLSQLH